MHEEACRWEHVMSETVERHVLELLRQPDRARRTATRSRAWRSWTRRSRRAAFREAGSSRLREVADALPDGEHAVVVVRRIGEPVQTDNEVMHRLRRVGLRPGAAIQIALAPGGVLISSGGEATELEPDLAVHVFVEGR